jgi:hypothetical protein
VQEIERQEGFMQEKRDSGLNEEEWMEVVESYMG